MASDEGQVRSWLSEKGSGFELEVAPGTAPWVLFTNDEVVFTKDENVLELMETRFKDAQKSDLRGIQKVPALSWHRPVAYQIADTGSGNQAAYPAVREVMSAVDGVLSDPVMGYGYQGAVIVIPVVVTRAPLFEVRLGSDGNTELQSVERSLLVSECDRWTGSTGSGSFMRLTSRSSPWMPTTAATGSPSAR